MSTKIFLGSKGWSVGKADSLTTFWADCLYNVGASTSYKPIGLHGLLQN
jgi:hypothetical protein